LSVPTEIAEFGRRHHEFVAREAQVLGVSTDTHYVHLAWRRQHPELRELPYPMLADVKRELASALGIVHKEEDVPLRTTFIVDAEGSTPFVGVSDLSAGRRSTRCSRVLDALKSCPLCPCEWRKASPRSREPAPQRSGWRAIRTASSG
jgi:alkyl hydroperoxide reductase subunit AhpC